MGKGPGTKSDIDYVIRGADLDQGYFNGVTLPSIAEGLSAVSSIGSWVPGIRFTPNGQPSFCPM